MITKKKYIAKNKNGDYIIDKRVARDRRTRDIKWITFIPCSNMKPRGAIRFYEDEKKWLEENNPNELEWFDLEEVKK